MLNLRIVVLISALALATFPLAIADEPLPAADSSTPASAPRGARRPSVDEARRQAKLLHRAMHTTLQVVHHEYYREDEGLTIPAATLKEVFAELEREEQVQLRWLAVEGQAMNTDHRANGTFETEAVKALKSGREALELVEGKLYRRAAPITLTSHCLKCHVPDRKSTRDHTAGLIISIPLADK
jgi:hypothetical protein